MSTYIQKLPVNTLGNDYVVGDLHGCFSLLERLLEEVHFDKSRDRLFSVGDLIDRGPESLRCLKLLAEPWFYAAQGNHENMMLNFFLPYLTSGKLERLEDVSGTGFLDYGGDWVEPHYQPDQQCMSAEFNRGLALILKMPLVCVVGEGKNRFHVIHAELLRSDYRSAEQVVWLDSDIDRWCAKQTVPPDVEDRLYWSRALMLSRSAVLDNAKIQPGLSTTFCGHTFAARPRQMLSHLCLDTGAFLSLKSYDDEEDEDYGLTLFDVQASRWFSASYQRNAVIRGDLPVPRAA